MSRKSLIAIIVVLLVLLAGMALNPSLERHRAALDGAISTRHPLAGALGLGKLAGLTLEYHSLGIASYTKADQRTISIGAYGAVWVLQEKP